MKNKPLQICSQEQVEKGPPRPDSRQVQPRVLETRRRHREVTPTCTRPCTSAHVCTHPHMPAHALPALTHPHAPAHTVHACAHPQRQGRASASRRVGEVPLKGPHSLPLAPRSLGAGPGRGSAPCCTQPPAQARGLSPNPQRTPSSVAPAAPPLGQTWGSRLAAASSTSGHTLSSEDTDLAAHTPPHRELAARGGHTWTGHGVGVHSPPPAFTLLQEAGAQGLGVEPCALWSPSSQHSVSHFPSRRGRGRDSAPWPCRGPRAHAPEDRRAPS